MTALLIANAYAGNNAGELLSLHFALGFTGAAASLKVQAHVLVQVVATFKLDAAASSAMPPVVPVRQAASTRAAASRDATPARKSLAQAKGDKPAGITAGSADGDWEIVLNALYSHAYCER